MTKEEKKYDTMQYASVTALRNLSGGMKMEVHLQTNMLPPTLDEALDRAKKEIGTHDETPLDRFLEETEMEPSLWQESGGNYYTSLNASWKTHEYEHSLYQAYGRGQTPAAARRDLARRISGKILVQGLWLSMSRETQVPDLTEKRTWRDQEAMLRDLRDMLAEADPETVSKMQATLAEHNVRQELEPAQA